MFKTIVVGVDGLAGGRDALALASLLAGPEHAEIVAVRAFPPEAYISPLDPGGRRARTGAALQRELAEAGIVGGRAEAVAERSPARALRRVAARERADLIVVGSSHRGPLGRVFFGDVAVRAFHGSPCAVGVAPRGLAADLPAGAGPRIGVGFDDHAEGREALRFAAALARRRGARLHAMSVVTVPATLASTPGWDDTWVDAAREEAVAHLRRALADLPDVETSAAAVVGMPDTELSTLSRDVDLLVLGSRAWGAMRRALLGSTAATLSHSARCPLLVLPRGARWDEPGGSADSGELVRAAS